MGTSTLIFALPVGWIADKVPRNRVIAVGGLIYLGAISLFVYAVTPRSSSPSDVKQEYNLLIFASVLWGVASAFSSGPVKAMLADSIPAGSRSMWFSVNFLANTIPSSVGPAVSIILFRLWGTDQWTQVPSSLTLRPHLCNCFLTNSDASPP